MANGDTATISIGDTATISIEAFTMAVVEHRHGGSAS